MSIYVQLKGKIMSFNYQLWLDQVENFFRKKGEVSDNWTAWADWEQLCKDGKFANDAAAEVWKARQEKDAKKIEAF